MVGAAAASAGSPPKISELSPWSIIGVFADSIRTDLRTCQEIVPRHRMTSKETYER